MEDGLGNSVSKKQIVIMGIAVLLVIIIAVFWAFNSTRTPKSTSTTGAESAEAVRVAAEKAAAPEVNVPTSANPIKQSLPSETPQQKTNPFNKSYVNPFE